MLQPDRSYFRFPVRSTIFFFNLQNSSSCTMVLELIQPVNEMSTIYIPGGKARPALKIHNLTAISLSTI
jgi:hypothetical protein